MGSVWRTRPQTVAHLDGWFWRALRCHIFIFLTYRGSNLRFLNVTNCSGSLFLNDRLIFEITRQKVTNSCLPRQCFVLAEVPVPCDTLDAMWYVFLRVFYKQYCYCPATGFRRPFSRLSIGFLYVSLREVAVIRPELLRITHTRPTAKSATSSTPAPQLHPTWLSNTTRHGRLARRITGKPFLLCQKL